MTANSDVLTMLGYPLTSNLLGTVYVYEFTDKIFDAWDELREDFRVETRSTANLPYAGLATALRAVGRTSLNFDPVSRTSPPRRMIAGTKLKGADLKDAITIWHQVVCKVPDDNVRLSFGSKLAALISAVKPTEVNLSERVSKHGSQPDAADWIYDSATWKIASAIAEYPEPWEIDGRKVRFRYDTNGNLIVWDPGLLWAASWKGGEPSYAALRVGLSMATFPWLPYPVVVADPKASRLTRWVNAAGSAFLEQTDPKAPLLCLNLEKGRPEYSSRIALALYAQLRAEGRPLVPSEFDLARKDSPLRALVPNSIRFPVGRGVGMFLTQQLSYHLTRVLNQEPLTARAVAGHQFSKAHKRRLDDGRDTDLLHPEELGPILTAAGCQRLRVLALYQHEHTRGRVQRLLAYHFARPELADEGIPYGTVFPLNDHVEVVIQAAKDLLEHGEHDQRADHAEKLVGLHAPVGTRVLALCETSYNAAEWARLRKLARRKNSTTPDPDITDAKPVVNELLAKHGIAAQFLATGDDDDDQPIAAQDLNADDQTDDDDDSTDPLIDLETVEPSNPQSVLGNQLRKDHAGHNAIGDMLRAAGLAHPRLTRALSHGRFTPPEGISLVGLHVRQQKGAFQQSGLPALAWIMTVMVPEGEYWRLKAYTTTAHPRGGATGWQDYTDANLAFRANQLPTGRRRDSDLTNAIEAALGQLAPHLPANGGYALFVTGEERNLWPLLANRNIEREVGDDNRIDGRIVFPGSTLALEHRPRAVVRITAGSATLPRPAFATTVKVQPGETEAPKIKRTTQALYQLDDSQDLWVLANVPRQFQGATKKSRVGLNSTRWAAEDVQQRWPWHSHNATEIYVAKRDTDALTYAVLAARLCDHALSWEGRTRYPAPIHLAAQMDKDHPQYRRTIDIDDEIDPEDLEPEPQP